MEISKSSIDGSKKKREELFSQKSRHQKLRDRRCGLAAVWILSALVVFVGVIMLAILKTDIESARHQMESLRQLVNQQTPQSKLKLNTIFTKKAT